MKSIEQMVKQCEGLIGTKDVTPFENGFLTGITEFVEKHGTTRLSPKQIGVIERIYEKHFA